jgi:hypothetical protein
MGRSVIKQQWKNFRQHRSYRKTFCQWQWAFYRNRHRRVYAHLFCRYKANIKPIENALQVNALQGISYDWNKEKFPEKEFNDRHQIGISAQELEKVYPEMVFTDDKGYKTVDYSRLTPVLTEAVKELSTESAEMKAMMAQMQREIQQLKQQ